MKDRIYVTGHRNPDTDSICSAMAYAELKRRLGLDAVAVRLGDISRETQFVLGHFGLQQPEFIETVRTQLLDFDMDPVTPISPETSLRTAWTLIKQKNAGSLSSLPVVDDNNKLLGMVTLSDITSQTMDAFNTGLLAASNVSLMNVLETINGKLISGEIFKITGKVIVAAMTPDKLGDVETGDLVIVANREENQRAAIENGAAALVLTGGVVPSDSVLALAQKSGCAIIESPFDTFSVATLITQSIPVRHVMTAASKLMTFDLDDYLDDVKDTMQKTRFRCYPVVDADGRIQGLTSRFQIIRHKKKKVIMVDHNEKVQSVPGIEEADVLEIIDHHRVAAIQTDMPIFFRNEPVGCTATIVQRLFFENGVRPSRATAGILCAAILSDTLKFKSPTCTQVDIMAAQRLAEIAGIKDMEDFADQMFAAGSSLEGYTTEEVLCRDFKAFKVGQLNVGVGQVYSTKLDAALQKDLLNYMDEIVETKDYALVALLLTDIIKEGSRAFCCGPKREIFERAFSVELKDNECWLQGVVSRKKQVIPALSKAAEEI